MCMWLLGASMLTLTSTFCSHCTPCQQFLSHQKLVQTILCCMPHKVNSCSERHLRHFWNTWTNIKLEILFFFLQKQTKQFISIQVIEHYLQRNGVIRLFCLWFCMNLSLYISVSWLSRVCIYSSPVWFPARWIAVCWWATQTDALCPDSLESSPDPSAPL